MRNWSNHINQKGKGVFIQKEIHQEAEAEWRGEEKQCFHEEDLGKFSHNMDCLSKDFPGSETDLF